MLSNEEINSIMKEVMAKVGGEIDLVEDTSNDHPLQKIFFNKESKARYAVQCDKSFDLNTYIFWYLENNPLDYKFAVYIGDKYIFIFDAVDLSNDRQETWIEKNDGDGIYYRPVVTTEDVKSVIYDRVNKEILKNTIT